VYLGVRPKGSTPGFHVLGRETFIAGIDWIDGWPVFDEDRYHVPGIDTAFSEDFSGSRLDSRWVVPAGEPERVAAPNPAGGIRLTPLANGSPGLLCTRVRDLGWAAEATIAGAGSFLLRIDDRYCYGLTVQEAHVQAWAQLGDLRHELGSAVGGTETTLRIESVPASSPTVPLGHGGPDDVVLSVATEAGSTELGRLDGRHLSTEVASGFTGRMLAIQGAESPGTVLSVSYKPQT
jgi:hypothetical protein